MQRLAHLSTGLGVSATGVMSTLSMSCFHPGPSHCLKCFTSGLGLYEYMTFCEDLDMEAIMAVWSGEHIFTIFVGQDQVAFIYIYTGYSLGGDSVAQADLGPYIQQAVDQVRCVKNSKNPSISTRTL